MVSNNIVVHRAEKGISQQKLAAAIGVSRKTISTIETGRFTPSVQIALCIAEYFNTPVESIFRLEKPSN
nr:helix-turn-helix transcriptional regulator [Rheinheimera sp. UJ51]